MVPKTGGMDYGGRGGVSARVRELAHAALEYTRQNDLTVIAICPFVQGYVAGHPQYQPFVTASVA